MIVRIRYTKAVDHGGEMELWVNNEDLFAVLDRVKPAVLADYLTMRLKARDGESKRKKEGGAA